MNGLEYGTIFEKGVPNPFGEYFTGQSYLAMLKQLNGVGVALDVKHWHGAAKDSWFAHIAIEVPGENTSNE